MSKNKKPMPNKVRKYELRQELSSQERIIAKLDRMKRHNDFAASLVQQYLRRGKLTAAQIEAAKKLFDEEKDDV